MRTLLQRCELLAVAKRADWRSGDFGVQTLSAIVEYSEVNPSAIEDVIVGCVSQAGERSN